MDFKKIKSSFIDFKYQPSEVYAEYFEDNPLMDFTYSEVNVEYFMGSYKFYIRRFIPE